jgi:hypothetical protein
MEGCGLLAIPGPDRKSDGWVKRDIAAMGSTTERCYITGDRTGKRSIR